jgi:hypothetical protein
LPEGEAFDDSETGKVLTALSSPKYLWRTLPGIASETGLPTDRIQEIINSRNDILHTLSGKENPVNLYTTADHYVKKAGIGRRLLTALSGDLK